MSTLETTPQTPEPTTPAWLTALGALLFVTAGVWWATRPTPPPIVADTAAEAAAATATAAASANAPPAAAAGTAPHLAAAGGLPGAQQPQHRSARPVDPTKAGDIQRLMNRIPKQR